MTEDAARALLERGVPFTFNTVEPGSGHLQAVIGHDGRRGTLLIREPSSRVSVEALADKILHRYRAFGPRGMAIVPAEHAERFDCLDLPDAELWDQLHAFDGALVRHCRDEAHQIYELLRTVAPGHRVTRDARRRLAVYDANATERLEAVASLLEIADDDPCLQLEQLGCLRGLSQRAERLAIYEKIFAAGRPHAVFLQQYAEELRADSRELPEAARLARRAVRLSPLDGGSYHVLASVYWEQRRFAEAMEALSLRRLLERPRRVVRRVLLSLACAVVQEDGRGPAIPAGALSIASGQNRGCRCGHWSPRFCTSIAPVRRSRRSRGALRSAATTPSWPSSRRGTTSRSAAGIPAARRNS